MSLPLACACWQRIDPRDSVIRQAKQLSENQWQRPVGWIHFKHLLGALW